MLSLILGFLRDVDETCTFLGYYAASCGNCLPNLGLLTLEDGADTLSRNVGKRRCEITQKSADLNAFFV
jgi:hypothetical protein